MRIDAYMQVNQLYQSNKAKKTKASETASGSSDKFEISDFGKELSIAKQAVSESPDIREDKVNELKSAFESGSYDLSMERLADKLVDKYFG